MRHSSGKRGVPCSFCSRDILTDRIDIMGFRLHRDCADKLGAVLGKVKAFNQWEKAHPRERAFELTA